MRVNEIYKNTISVTLMLQFSNFFLFLNQTHFTMKATSRRCNLLVTKTEAVEITDECVTLPPECFLKLLTVGIFEKKASVMNFRCARVLVKHFLSKGLDLAEIHINKPEVLVKL